MNFMLIDLSYDCHVKRTFTTTVKRPTNATDSVSLVREWLYNRRSELTSATVGDEIETKVGEIKITLEPIGGGR